MAAIGGVNTKLSSRMTVGRYRELEFLGDRRALGNFIVERFIERYFRPIEGSTNKHGFSLLAIGCLVIETLESFYQGRADTRRISKRMFHDFFGRDTPLKVFGGGDDWFYRDIRCGILHQGETRGGWRVLRNGRLLDSSAKTINATQFLRELRKTLAAYAGLLETDDVCWSQFKKKMNAVCSNCE